MPIHFNSSTKIDNCADTSISLPSGTKKCIETPNISSIPELCKSPTVKYNKVFLSDIKNQSKTPSHSPRKSTNKLVRSKSQKKYGEKKRLSLYTN